MVKAVVKKVVKSLGTQKNDIAYIHAVLLDQEHGVLDSLLPQVMERYHSIFVAKGRDPDLPMVQQAMAGPYREEFLEAMRIEIEKLKIIILGL